MKSINVVFCYLSILCSIGTFAQAQTNSCETHLRELTPSSTVSAASSQTTQGLLIDQLVQGQRKQFVENLEEAIARKSNSKKLPNTQWIGVLPSQTRSIPTQIDKVDEAMWKTSAHLQIEVGRIEVQNAKGETLGLAIFSSSSGSQISGQAIKAGLLKALAQAWAQNEYFNIAKLILSHTHPGDGTLNFSGGDKEAFVAFKQDMELLGLKDADFEGHLLAAAFFNEFKKKGIVIPAHVLPVHKDIGANLTPEAAAQDWATIESLGTGYKEGKINLKDLLFTMPKQINQIFTSYHQ